MNHVEECQQNVTPPCGHVEVWWSWWMGIYEYCFKEKYPLGIENNWKITMFNGKSHYGWPFSIAMLNCQSVVWVATDFLSPCCWHISPILSYALPSGTISSRTVATLHRSPDEWNKWNDEIFMKWVDTFGNHLFMRFLKIWKQHLGFQQRGRASTSQPQNSGHYLIFFKNIQERIHLYIIYIYILSIFRKLSATNCSSSHSL